MNLHNNSIVKSISGEQSFLTSVLINLCQLNLIMLQIDFSELYY